jgi:hypothetical protein
MEQVVNDGVLKKLKQKKYNVPIIGHFSDKSILFSSIIQASNITGIPYHLIFDNAIGKIKSASRVGFLNKSYWEFENGVHYLKYKSHDIRHKSNYKRITGFNG